MRKNERWLGEPRGESPDGLLEMPGGENVDNLRQLRSRCVHADAVVVHVVPDSPYSYSAHCLKCGTIGPVCQTPEGARQAIWSHVKPPGLGGRRD